MDLELEWNVREQDDCEVGEASNGSGLMKKTFSIPACGGVHHVGVHHVGVLLYSAGYSNPAWATPEQDC